ncbi:hypothetical protein LCGC14_1470040 [marine sediment metagenome]|uniref:Uncharacterized protein n=1 Tax=marine sediment metagenome TaxID=412755 RepID=A0A0F9MEF6_9ZZZZ
MTDLSAKCPKCGKKTTNYLHYVDHFGMGKAIPNGTYDLRCTSYYTNEKEEDFCGHVFKVKVDNKVEVEVVE